MHEDFGSTCRLYYSIQRGFKHARHKKEGAHIPPEHDEEMEHPKEEEILDVHKRRQGESSGNIPCSKDQEEDALILRIASVQ